MTIKVEIKGDAFKLFIDDLLHLFIADRIIGMQSYIKEDKWFIIELYTKNKDITVEYDSRDKWIKILKELDKIL